MIPDSKLYSTPQELADEQAATLASQGKSPTGNKTQDNINTGMRIASLAAQGLSIYNQYRAGSK